MCSSQVTPSSGSRRRAGAVALSCLGAALSATLFFGSGLAQAGAPMSPAHSRIVAAAGLGGLTPAEGDAAARIDAPAANPFGFTSATTAAQCGSSCHSGIYSSWATGAGSDLPAIPVWDAADEAAFTSGDLGALDPYDTTAQGNMHSLAWRDYEFQLVYHEQPEGLQGMCQRCHVPDSATAAQRKLLVFAPASRGPTAANAGDGISCVSCHLDSAGNILGPESENRTASPTLIAEDDHPVVGSRAFADGTTLCASCHNDSVFGAFTKTVDENQQQGGDSCVDCHMDDDFGREGHTWPGGQSATFRGQALALTIPRTTTSSQGLSIQARNVGAGHNVPTGDKFRAFAVHARAVDASGAVRLDEEVFITPLLQSPAFAEAGDYLRVDPIARESSASLGFGSLPAGSYTLQVDLTYYQIKPTTLVYRDGHEEDIEAYGAKPVRSWTQALTVN